MKVEAPTMFDVVAEPVPDDAPFFYRVESLEPGPSTSFSLDGRSTTRTVDFLDDCDVFFSITGARGRHRWDRQQVETLVWRRRQTGISGTRHRLAALVRQVG